MLAPKERITIIADEQLTILTPEITEITEANRSRIAVILRKAIEAAELRRGLDEKKRTKQAVQDRLMQVIMVTMLESPSGITKGDFLVAGETDDLLDITTKFRVYLRRNNIYKLKKRINNKQTVYILDPIR